MSEVRVNGVSLYYEEHGTGGPILCIHDGGSSAALWGDAVAELARHGRVIVYDRRGCTRSQRPDPYDVTTVREHADDAAGLLEALDAAPAAVIGRSYGGEIAVDLAQRRPELVRALVLLEPGILTLTPETNAWAQTLQADLQAAAAAGGPAAAAEGFYRRVLSDATWQAFPPAVRQLLVDNGPALLAEMNGEPFTVDPDTLARLTAPVLIVSGDSSPPAFRAVDTALAQMIPRARHEVIAGGHVVNPAAPVVLTFLDDVVTARH